MTASATHVSAGAIVCILAVFILATLTPQPGSTVGADFFQPLLPESPDQWWDVAQNLLLYLPVGFLLGTPRFSGLQVALIAFGLSLAAELAQFGIPGRDPSIRDVVMNLIGALAGRAASLTYLGTTVAERMIRAAEAAKVTLRYPSRQMSARLSLRWALLVSLVILVTCWLESVAFPPPVFFGVASSVIDQPDGPLRIGSDGNGERGFNGLIDEVRIYTRALPPPQISADMNRPVAVRASDPDLVAAFGFDSHPMETAEAGGSRWTPEGRFGGAVSFDGRSSQVIVSDAAFDVSRGLTLEAWVFPFDHLIDDASVIAAADDRFFLRASSDTSRIPRAGVRFAGAPRMVGARRSLARRRWTHLAATYDAQRLRIYVNGQLAGVFNHWSTHQPQSLVLNEAELPFGMMRNPQQLPSVLQSAFSLDVTVRCGVQADQPAPVFLIAGLQGINALELLAAGSELRLRFPQRARGLGLASVDYRVPRALNGCVPGKRRSFHLQGPLQEARLYDQNGIELRGVRLWLGSAWRFLLDSQLMPLWLVAAVSACYLGLLVSPFGYWARPTALSAAGGLILLASVAILPRLWGLAPPGRLEIASMVTGVIAGVLSSWRARRSPESPA